jgi:hypothetical protein
MRIRIPKHEEPTPSSSVCSRFYSEEGVAVHTLEYAWCPGTNVKLWKRIQRPAPEECIAEALSSAHFERPASIWRGDLRVHSLADDQFGKHPRNMSSGFVFGRLALGQVGCAFASDMCTTCGS